MINLKKTTLRESYDNDILSFLREEEQLLEIQETITPGEVTGRFFYKNLLNTIPIFSDSSYNLSYLNFEVLTHTEEKVEAPSITNLNASSIFSFLVNLEYNFLIKAFEDYVTSTTKVIPEVNLPNFYDTVLEELIKSPETRFDSIDFFEKNLSTKYPQLPVKETYKKVSYDSKISQDLLKAIQKNELADNFKTPNIYSYFKTFNPFKEQFPFYTEIFFNNSLENSSGEKNFTYIFDKFEIYKKTLDEFALKSQDSSILVNKKIFDAVQPQPVFSNLSIKRLDPINFLNAIIQNNEIVGDTNEFTGKINELLSLKKLNLRQIIKNEPCYSEVIGYKITKYDTINGTVPLQEFYLPGVLSNDKIEFIDTQVKYGKNYRYKLSLIVAVIDSGVKFSQKKIPVPSIPSSNRPPDTVVIEYSIKPAIKMYEVESAEYQNILYDNPPLDPEVEILPLIGIHNKFKINLNTSVGRKTEKPVSFSAEEESLIKKLLRSQDRIDGKLIYESEEPSDYFEMYKLETAPRSVEDFLSGKKIVIDNLESSAGSFVDSVSSNKKYYYIFRSFDYHKNFSNPTPIYEVEIVNDNGMIFPIVNIFEINKESLKEPTKKMKRYLSISPSLGNKLIDLERNNEFKGLTDKKEILEKLLVGVNKEDVWGKKFKIRVNSISSGKKIDINIAFDVKKIEE